MAVETAADRAIFFDTDDLGVQQRTLPAVELHQQLMEFLTENILRLMLAGRLI